MYCNAMYLNDVFMIVFGPLKPRDKEDQIRWVWTLGGKSFDQQHWCQHFFCDGSEKAVQLLNEDSGHPKAIYVVDGFWILRLPWRTIRKGQNAWQLSVAFVQCGKTLLVNRVQLPAFKKVFHRAKGRGAIRLKKTRVLLAFLTVAYATSALYLALEIIVKRF